MVLAVILDTILNIKTPWQNNLYGKISPELFINGKNEFLMLENPKKVVLFDHIA